MSHSQLPSDANFLVGFLSGSIIGGGLIWLYRSSVSQQTEDDTENANEENEEQSSSDEDEEEEQSENNNNSGLNQNSNNNGFNNNNNSNNNSPSSSTANLKNQSNLKNQGGPQSQTPAIQTPHGPSSRQNHIMSPTSAVIPAQRKKRKIKLNPAEIEHLKKIPKRYGQVIKLAPEKYKQYKTLHAAVWPDVLRRLYDCNIRNYTIYYRDGWLFSHYEYIGDDFEGDMELMREDPIIINWWKICEKCQIPLHWEGPPPSQVKKPEKLCFRFIHVCFLFIHVF